MLLTLHNIAEHIRNYTALKCLSPTLENNIFRITEPVSIQISDGTIFDLLPGWEYDGASVPWIGQPIFPKWGVYAYQSFVHDILYFTLYEKGQKFADMEHYRWGIATGVSQAQNRARYKFLRTWGWTAWNRSKHRPSDRAKANRLLTYINGIQCHQ
ncbi:DUF1353 domain-containing protein [Edaphocola aurantiacus]|uniref:DUF1353 domain-containing protein n=1 Tax=Edaphocola aurantiacus TaxID=2601682 RepID=UPI001C9604D2|nr:DUF1353 domain-containing protein [Edaphocola aurantiacus]